MNELSTGSREYGRLDAPETKNASLLIPASITIALIAISIWLHFAGTTSLTQDDQIWTQRVEVIHGTYYALSSRHFTTYSVYALNSIFGLSYRVAFILLQYLLASILAWVFYRFLRTIGFDRVWSSLGLIMLLGSYPILAAHFQPVFTWDDFWQYIASVGAFWMIIRRQPVGAAFLFSVGAIARESTMILYPVFVYALIIFSDRRSWKFFSLALLPLAVVIAYQGIVYVPPPNERFTNFDKNFMNPTWARHTFYSLLVSFGSLWLFAGLASVRHMKENIDERILSVMSWGAIFSIPATIAIVLTMGLARETRLFFPPFVFIIPLSLWFFQRHSKQLIQFNVMGAGIPGAVVVTVALVVGKRLAEVLFPSFDFRAWLEFSQTYLGIHFGIAIAIVFQLVVMSLYGLWRRPDSIDR